MPNKLNFRQITLALAAVFQSCYLADEIAMTGKTDEKNFNDLIQPIFNLNPKNFSELYHDPKYLKQGLHELQKVFNKKAGQPNRNISRYGITLLMLQSKLKHNKLMLEELRRRIEQAKNQVNFFSTEHPTVISNLGDIYYSTISTLKQRTQIIGRTEILKNEFLFSKIRAILLAGIRAAVLWQQVGGTRWQLFFARKKMSIEIESLLKEQQA